ncbi:mucin-1-like [Macrobrachium nipponense]|uniref:mucin-1-like n=1 Tax=Macrobrachium nipponense TaxID=159736 RepID=UPI0030C80ED7
MPNVQRLIQRLAGSGAVTHGAVTTTTTTISTPGYTAPPHLVYTSHVMTVTPTAVVQRPIAAVPRRGVPPPPGFFVLPTPDFRCPKSSPLDLPPVPRMLMAEAKPPGLPDLPAVPAAPAAPAATAVPAAGPAALAAPAVSAPARVDPVHGAAAADSGPSGQLSKPAGSASKGKRSVMSSSPVPATSSVCTGKSEVQQGDREGHAPHDRVTMLCSCCWRRPRPGMVLAGSPGHTERSGAAASSGGCCSGHPWNGDHYHQHRLDPRGPSHSGGTGGSSAGPPAPTGAGPVSPSARKKKTGTRRVPANTGTSLPGASGPTSTPGSGSASRSREVPSVRSPAGDCTAKAQASEFARRQDQGTERKAGESHSGDSRQASDCSRSKLQATRVAVTVPDRPWAEAEKRSPQSQEPALAGSSGSTHLENREPVPPRQWSLQVS